MTKTEDYKTQLRNQMLELQARITRLGEWEATGYSSVVCPVTHEWIPSNITSPRYDKNGFHVPFVCRVCGLEAYVKFEVAEEQVYDTWTEFRDTGEEEE